MKFSLKSVTLLLAAFTTGENIVSSQVTGQPDTVRLEKHISILHNKLFFDFPAASVISPRVADIMAADPNENRETRIIAENGKMRLVFFAQELYALGGKTLFEDISKEMEPGFDFKRKIIFDKDSILAILSTPALFDSTSSAILVNSLLVKSPDNTVCRIDVYINPEAYPLREEYARLTENVFNTITKGTRRIDLGAKEETYKIFGTESKFIFKLPKNYLVTVDEKYDFGVFKFNKYKNSLSDTTYTSLTIYTGHHPNYFHKEYGYTENKAMKTKGQFLQSNIEWLYFKDDEQSFYLKEQFIPVEAVEKGLILHVAMLTNKKDILEELVKIVENIKVLK
jgi:hypothetical protein